jgi:outer membrane protein assembly factor BamB
VSLYGQLSAAPLVVGDRLRIHAEKRRLYAEGPVDYKVIAAPAWAYRRWPAELVGVVAFQPSGARPGLVVSEWSDGAVVAIGADTGRVVWRRTVAEPAAGYAGRRTGAATVYEPPGLLTTHDAVIVTRGAQVAGYDPATGRPLWRLDRGCAAPDFTGPAVYATAACGDERGLRLYDAVTGQQVGDLTGAGATGGAATPWACAVGRSGCRLVTLRGATYAIGGWPGGGRNAGSGSGPGSLTMVPHAPAGDTGRGWLAGAVFVDGTADGSLRGIDAGTGSRVWSTAINGRAVGADERGVYVVTDRYALQVLDPRSGLEVSRVVLRRPAEREDWRPGYVYLHDGLVAIERLIGSASEPDTAYYYPDAPYVIAGVRSG